MRTITLVVAVLAAAACGSKEGTKATGTAKDDAGSGAPKVAPLAMPTIGVDAPKRMTFPWDAGSAAYDKAVKAYKAKPRDWSAIRTNCEASIQKDPMHFDAQRLLGTALAQLGEHAAAVDHLVSAMAGDFYKYAPSIAADEDLKGFLATPHGQAVTELIAKLDLEVMKRVASGVWVVARRSSFKWPTDKSGSATSRGELYAFDRETKRYIRLSHTGDQVVGYVKAPGGSEVALIGFDRLDRPKTEKEQKDNPTLIARGWVTVLDAKTWKTLGTRVNLASAREIAVGYGAGDQLLVSVAPANGRWGVGDAVVSSIDRTSGKLTKVTAAAPEPRVVINIDEGRLVHAAAGVTATWSGDPAASSALETAAGAKIAIPESGAVAKSTVSASDARVAFATSVDPCAKDAAPSLYVADAKSGALKHVLTMKSRFATRWIEPTILAYEDGEGAVRLWDATSGREVMKLDNKVGIALDALSLGTSPLCKAAPPVVEPAGSGSGSDDTMPPEDSGSDSAGPVTTPGSN